MIESKDDLLESIRNLVDAWNTRGVLKASAELHNVWPPPAIMTSGDWAHLLESLKKARTEGAGEITEREKASLDEAILLLEAWVYRC